MKKKIHKLNLLSRSSRRVGTLLWTPIIFTWTSHQAWTHRVSLDLLFCSHNPFCSKKKQTPCPPQKNVDRVIPRIFIITHSFTFVSLIYQNISPIGFGPTHTGILHKIKKKSLLNKCPFFGQLIFFKNQSLMVIPTGSQQQFRNKKIISC